LEGKTRDEAAAELGLTTTTVRGRLERGRDRLRLRLALRGVAFPAALLAAGLAREYGVAAVPATLVVSISKAAALVAAHQTTGCGLVSVQVAALTEGVLKAMFITKLKLATAVLVVLGIFGVGAGLRDPNGAVLSAREAREPAAGRDKDAAAPADAKPSARKPDDRRAGNRSATLKIRGLVEKVDAQAGTITVIDQTRFFTFLGDRPTDAKAAALLFELASQGSNPARYVNLLVAKDARVTAGDHQGALKDLKAGTYAELELAAGPLGLVAVSLRKIANPVAAWQEKRAGELEAISDFLSNDLLRAASPRDVAPAPGDRPAEPKNKAKKREDITGLIKRLGRLPAELTKTRKTDAEIVNELFRASLKRVPAESETAAMMKHLHGAKDRTEKCRDILWALLNTREFLKLQGLDGNLAESLRLLNQFSEEWEKKSDPQRKSEGKQDNKKQSP
jgi:hypothetical protein